MTLVEHSGDSFVFEVQSRERDLLAAILKLYPVLNPDYHELSRTKTRDKRVKESQEMLHEALAEQRALNKKMVVQFLAEENWEKHQRHYRVKLTAEKIEWLLQVLNDVRVGSWVILGKPDHETGEKASLTIENMPYAGALELSGYFQMALLQAKAP